MGSGNVPNQPPHVGVLAVLTDANATVGVEVFEAGGEEGDPFRDMFDLEDAEESPPSDAAEHTEDSPEGVDPSWRHRPPATAVVDRDYRIDLARVLSAREENGSADGEWTLETGPPSMSVDGDTGALHWVPAPEEEGRWEVEVRFQERDGTDLALSWPVVAGSRMHVLGTDERGRDVMRMLVSSLRWMFVPGLLAVLISVGGGALLGALAGYSERGVGGVIRKGLQVVESVPGLLLVIVVAVASDFDLAWVMAGVGLALLPSVASEVGTLVKEFRRRPFIEASREMGLTDRQILWKEIMWFNARPTLARFLWKALAFVVLMEVTLSFLGVGVQAPAYSWGTMLMQGRDRLLSGEYWMVVFPALTVMLVLALCHLLGARAKRAVATGEEVAA